MSGLADILLTQRYPKLPTDVLWIKCYRWNSQHAIQVKHKTTFNWQWDCNNLSLKQFTSQICESRTDWLTALVKTNVQGNESTKPKDRHQDIASQSAPNVWLHMTHSATRGHCGMKLIFLLRNIYTVKVLLISVDYCLVENLSKCNICCPSCFLIYPSRLTKLATLPTAISSLSVTAYQTLFCQKCPFWHINPSQRNTMRQTPRV